MQTVTAQVQAVCRPNVQKAGQNAALTPPPPPPAQTEGGLAAHGVGQPPSDFPGCRILTLHLMELLKDSAGHLETFFVFLKFFFFFSMFIITALPVLARVVGSTRMHRPAAIRNSGASRWQQLHGSSSECNSGKR